MNRTHSYSPYPSVMALHPRSEMGCYIVSCIMSDGLHVCHSLFSLWIKLIHKELKFVLLFRAICHVHYSMWHKIFKHLRILLYFEILKYAAKLRRKSCLLSGSTELYGILQPLSVKQKKTYQLKDKVTSLENDV